MDRTKAVALAEEWVAAWNAHDLERVLSHYADDATFFSPIAQQRTGKGRVNGKAELRAYWGPALATLTDLHFDIVEVLVGFDSLTILYDSRGRGRVAETLELGADGLVTHAVACYAR